MTPEDTPPWMWTMDWPQEPDTPPQERTVLGWPQEPEKKSQWYTNINDGDE